MSHISELHNYIARLRLRLRLGACLRGAAIFAGTALGVTLALVLLLNHFAFPAHGVTAGRVLMAAALAAAAAFGLALPILRLTRAHAVRHAEKADPDLEQRLTTFEERATRGDDPFLELLAADTLKHTEEIAPEVLVPRNRLLALGGAGLGCLAVLLWTVAAGPGYLGYGASLLWTGAKKDAAPLYSIAVKPGNATVRRNADQLIFAHVTGMQPGDAHLFARFQSATGWEPVAMKASPDPGGGASYRFTFAGIPENVEYYVTAGPLTSPHYKLHVVDLPSVQQVNVTYRYPAWTGLKPVTEEHSGDLRAIEGTDAQLQIRMNRPLKDGQLVLDGGQAIHLSGGANNTYTARIHMEKDGAYHLASAVEGQPVRLSEDYFIATDKAQPPQVAIDRPMGDYRASPIEEVTVGVKASDEFGLRDMHLHYSVNGGPDHDMKLLDKPGAKEAAGAHTIALEGLKLVPGDVISLYATARDGHSQAQTDISFIQVDPFEREFTQSQTAGGGGGGGGGSGANQTEISKREKELIAATWKQENDKKATAKDKAAQGQFLADAQQKLRDQVKALSIRMQSRDIAQANQVFNDFNKDMQAAAAVMGPSADTLKSTHWKEALPLEQKALQSLLRAEATFRQIEVAFGGQGGGGGGGGSTGRDLASLFDLELDTEKNQYETAQTASPAEQHQKQIDDALARLDALARRQEDLANQPHDPQQSFQQRWQQEMLRREAEQLQRQIEQMARNQQGQQGQQGTGGQQAQSQQNGQQQGQQGAQQSGARRQSGSSSAGGSQQQSASAQGGGQGGGQGSSGAQSARSGSSGAQGQSSDRRIADALSRLQQATEMMKRNSGAQQSEEDARAAAERLRQAQNLLAGSAQQLASGRVGSMASEAGRLAQQERTQSAAIDNLARAGQQASSSESGGTPNLDRMRQLIRQRDQLAAERQQLSDDLSKLERSMRATARDLAPAQPDVAKDLRDALSQMDGSQLGMYVQRTADWLRSGINPNANGTEGQIAQGLGKLSGQLQQAQSAMAQERPGAGKPGQDGAGQGDQSAALNLVERLRSQLEAMTRGQSGRGSQSGQSGPGRNGPSGQRGAQQLGSTDALSRNGQPTGGGGNQARGGNYGGDTRAGGGGSGGTAWGNFDTGGNTPRARGQQQAVPTDASGNPADTERSFDQQMRALRQMRQMVGDDPQAAKQVEDLTRQMQNLDPRRFPGNPAMVEQMHRELLGSVDQLELQLQRNDAETGARTGKPDTIPAGYQDAVAEYYRRLSGKQ